eukprot:gb/GFBE01017821.1/.p1 GENE.gb/GFBE01017821.1/~~gb/GFBE01017821.1/.p1  ORF type:complete len:140 (+),score=10.88 gb/GFBE01017821.1/:1-420(+)
MNVEREISDVTSQGCSPALATQECSLCLRGVPIGSTLSLRGATTGDRFCPGLSSKARTIKLTKFLHRSMQVSLSDRPGWPVIAIRSPQGEEIVAAVLPDQVAGDFSVAVSDDPVPPVVVQLTWQIPWHGLSAYCDTLDS